MLGPSWKEVDQRHKIKQLEHFTMNIVSVQNCKLLLTTIFSSVLLAAKIHKLVLKKLAIKAGWKNERLSFGWIFLQLINSIQAFSCKDC